MHYESHGDKSEENRKKRSASPLVNGQMTIQWSVQHLPWQKVWYPKTVRFQHNTNLHLDILDSSKQLCSFVLKHKRNKDATMQRTTHPKVTAMTGKAGETVCPGNSNRNLAMQVSHSIRDCDCVCLDEAQMSLNFTKKQLKFMHGTDSDQSCE